MNVMNSMNMFIKQNRNIQFVWKWASREMDTRHDLVHGSWHICNVMQNIYRYQTDFHLTHQELEDAMICGLLHDVCDKKILIKPKEQHVADIQLLLSALYHQQPEQQSKITLLTDISTNISFSRWYAGLIPETITANKIFLIAQLADSLEQLGYNSIFRIGLHVGQEFIKSKEQGASIHLHELHTVNSAMYYFKPNGKFAQIVTMLKDKYRDYDTILKEIDQRSAIVEDFYQHSLQPYRDLMTMTSIAETQEEEEKQKQVEDHQVLER